MEKTLGDYLRSASAVQEIVGDRVATKTPRTLAQPWVRVTVVDDPPAGKSSTDHNIAFYVQLDCYAGADGGEVEATRLGHTVRSLLAEMADGQHTDIVISGSKPTGSRLLPDDTFDPPRDRRVVTGIVWAHAAEEEGS